MKKIADILTFELEAAFEKAGYDKQYAKVTLSNRPDLCEYQCNGAMAAAKAYKKAPIMIANDVVEVLKESACIEQVEAVNPGFINIILDGEFVASYLGKNVRAGKTWCGRADKAEDDHCGLRRSECCKAASCRTSSLSGNWGKCKTNREICRT